MNYENVIQILGGTRKKIGRYIFNAYKSGEVSVSAFNFQCMQLSLIEEINDRFKNETSNKIQFVYDGPALNSFNNVTTELESFGPSALLLVDRMFLHTIEQLKFAVEFAETKGQPSNILA